MLLFHCLLSLLSLRRFCLFVEKALFVRCCGFWTFFNFLSVLEQFSVQSQNVGSARKYVWGMMGYTELLQRVSLFGRHLHSPMLFFGLTLQCASTRIPSAALQRDPHGVPTVFARRLRRQSRPKVPGNAHGWTAPHHSNRTHSTAAARRPTAKEIYQDATTVFTEQQFCYPITTFFLPHTSHKHHSVSLNASCVYWIENKTQMIILSWCLSKENNQIKNCRHFFKFFVPYINQV